MNRKLAQAIAVYLVAFTAMGIAATVSAEDDPLSTLSVLIHIMSRDTEGKEHVIGTFSVEDNFVPPTTNDWYVAPFKNPDGAFNAAEISSLVGYFDRYKIKDISFENKQGINDAALAQVATLKNLTSLNLNGTAVTGKGLLPLKKARHLQSIGVIANDISEDDVERLEGLLGHTLRRISPLPVIEAAPSREHVSERGVHSEDLHPGH